MAVENTPASDSDSDCVTSYLWVLFLFTQLGILVANSFIFFLEVSRLKRAKLKFDEARRLQCKYLWIHKVFLSSFTVNSVYCGITVLCTIVRVLWPHDRHLDFFAVMEDTFLELECAFTLLVASLEAVALFKLSTLSDCYPNVLRFNKRWVLFSSAATITIFGSLLSLQVAAVAASPSHSSHWNSVDHPLMSTKILALSALALIVLIMNFGILIRAPKIHANRQETILRIATENVKQENIPSITVSSVEQEEQELQQQQHRQRQQPQPPQSSGLKLVEEESHSMYHSQTSYESCVSNISVSQTQQPIEAANVVQNGVSRNAHFEIQEEVTFSEEVKRRPKKQQTKPNKPESAFSTTGPNRFSLRTESAFQNINNIFKVTSVLSLSASVREGVLPQGIVLSNTLKYIPVSCFVFSKSWFTAWHVARLPVVNCLVCILIMIHGFVHLTGILHLGDSMELSLPYCGRNNWLFYVAQILFNVAFLGLKPLFYMRMYSATKGNPSPQSPTGVSLL